MRRLRSSRVSGGLTPAARPAAWNRSPATFGESGVEAAALEGDLLGLAAAAARLVAGGEDGGEVRPPRPGRAWSRPAIYDGPPVAGEPRSPAPYGSSSPGGEPVVRGDGGATTPIRATHLLEYARRCWVARVSADPKVTFARIVGLASLQGLLSAAFWEILSFTRSQPIP